MTPPGTCLASSCLPLFGLFISQKCFLSFLFSFFELDFSFAFVLSFFFLHSENQKSIASMRVNPGLLNPTPLTFYSDNFLLWGQFCARGSAASLLHLPVMTIGNVFRNCQVSSRRQKSPLVENHW